MPAAALPPQIRVPINEALAGLGYRQVGQDWNAQGSPADPRIQAARACSASRPSAPGAGPAGGAPDLRLDGIALQISSRLAEAPEGRQAEVAARWPHLAGRALGIAVEGPGGQVAEFRPVIDGRDGAGGARAHPAHGPRAATLMGSAGTWASVLDGTANLAAELAGGRLRAADCPNPARIRPDELHAIAVLLGLPNIPPAPSRAGVQEDPTRMEDEHHARSEARR